MRPYDGFNNCVSDPSVLEAGIPRTSIQLQISMTPASAIMFIRDGWMLIYTWDFKLSFSSLTKVASILKHPTVHWQQEQNGTLGVPPFRKWWEPDNYIRSVFQRSNTVKHHLFSSNLVSLPWLGAETSHRFWWTPGLTQTLSSSFVGTLLLVAAGWRRRRRRLGDRTEQEGVSGNAGVCLHFTSSHPVCSQNSHQNLSFLPRP